MKFLLAIVVVSSLCFSNLLEEDMKQNIKQDIKQEDIKQYKEKEIKTIKDEDLDFIISECYKSTYNFFLFLGITPDDPLKNL